MASIHHDIVIERPAAAVWDAVRDVGALHERLVPGFVVATQMVSDAEPPVRSVTFASGITLDETIVDLDDTRRRLVWAIDAEFVAHHNGAMQVFDDGPDRSRVTWIADVLPDALADRFGPLMQAGLETMKRHLEG